MPGLLYADDIVLCGESEEDLREMVGHFGEVCRRIGLIASAYNSKGIVLGGKEGMRLYCVRILIFVMCFGRIKYI